MTVRNKPVSLSRHNVGGIRYGSTMVRAGAPLIVVSRALGHADTRMVDQHYAHLAPSYMADTISSTAPNLSL